MLNILARETKNSTVRSEFTLYVLLGICLIVCVRFMYNLSRNLDKQLLKRIDDPKISNRDLLLIYAVMIEPIYRCMDHNNSMGLSKPEHDIFLMFKGQMSKHNLVCND